MRRAFTLIELLVVAAIIALLAGLLFALVGYGTRVADASKNTALLQKVHAGLCDYRTIYNTFPPTPDDPLLGNGLVPYLLTPADAVTRDNRFSNVLVGEIPEDRIRGDDLVDAFTSRPLVYIHDQPVSGNPRDPIPLPPDPASDASDMRTEVFMGSEDGFELWSAGPDGLIAPQRNDPMNTDNISVTRPYGDLAVY